MKVYFAAPLFTQNERLWNRAITERIEELDRDIEIILPQKITFEGKFNDPKKYSHLFEVLVLAIDEADAIVAVLDGPDADSGTCWEVGYAFGIEKPIIGVRTDFRKSEDKGLNVMLRRCLTHYIFHMSFSENPDLIAREIAQKLDKVRKKLAQSKTDKWKDVMNQE